MERRELEVFLVLAEELHFGRTAERLHLSAAMVSRIVQRVERRIGAPLFARTSRRVDLTPLGRQLRDDLEPHHRGIQNALAKAIAAGRGVHGPLRLGVMGALGNEMQPVIGKFRAEYPGCTVDMVEIHFSDPFAALRAGRVDAQVTWLPVREADITAGPVVLTEGRVLAVPSHSDLAGRESVSLEDLADHTVPGTGPQVPEYWIEAMVPWSTPSGRPIPRGPAAPRTFHEVLTLVAGGHVVCPLNEHVTWYYSYPGVTFVPIHDAPPTEWALLWTTDGASAATRALAQIARTLDPRPITRGGTPG
ncbi:LysR family transcriptional regulator [Actinomadura kijaniata]|uniref:LysR family transcriptional regulator n=1 Tax=Actinomadura kijaniata TaxID=46161 RepID=UPI000A47A585|nr:LysR substrate-binding domain-containing protein [Actinomadura kijaniata]